MWFSWLLSYVPWFGGYVPPDLAPDGLTDVMASKRNRVLQEYLELFDSNETAKLRSVGIPLSPQLTYCMVMEELKSRVTVVE